MYLDIKEDMCQCQSCGHVFYHVWMGKPDVPAIERFPIECPKCGTKTGYRMDLPEEEDE